jgi:hypothetical protein
MHTAVSAVRDIVRLIGCRTRLHSRRESNQSMLPDLCRNRSQWCPRGDRAVEIAEDAAGRRESGKRLQVRAALSVGGGYGDVMEARHVPAERTPAAGDRQTGRSDDR